MRASGPIFAFALSLIAGLLAAQPAHAERAKFYTNPQLTLLFSGAAVTATGYCVLGSPGDMTINFDFKADGTFSADWQCVAHQTYLNSEKGTWSVANDEFCMESIDASALTVNILRCWPVRHGTYQFALFTGNTEAWQLDISHPRYPEKEKLLAALDGPAVRSGTEPGAMAAAPRPDERKADAAAARDPQARDVELARLRLEAERAKQEAELARLQQETERIRQEAEIARLRLEAERARGEVQAAQQAASAPDQAAAVDVEFGSYYALVIGIDNYKHLPKLNTAVNDAKTVARTLQDSYGFQVKLLLNSDRAQIIDTLDLFRETLGRKDNLLIYYAGHGWLDQEADRGYWLPADAHSNRRTNWVSNETVTDTLRTLQAKHVILVADSCYSGTLTRGANVALRSGDYWKRMADKFARVAMVSGGLEPVADGGGSGHSPFAKAFVDALLANTAVIDGTQLFNDVRRLVMVAARQTPQYSDVRNAGHDGGDFLFVRKK